MPICTSCTTPTPYLYTVYESAYNLRLEQCSRCKAFADPYVEHDTLTLLIDLILLKRGVYRHLLFNRGLGERKASARDTVVSLAADDDAAYKARAEALRETDRWMFVGKLGLLLVAVDAFIRWTYLGYSIEGPRNGSAEESEQWYEEALQAFLRTFVGCLVETVAFHLGIMGASFLVLSGLGLARRSSQSNTWHLFRYSHIPLTLLYSSLIKLFLLLLLSIWRPNSAEQSLTPWYANTTLEQEYHPLVVGALRMLDEDKLDREWVVRNVLGGMSAGFGLRVVLDCHPLFTTMIIITGWAVKNTAASLVSAWVGGGQEGQEAWMAYSIP